MYIIRNDRTREYLHRKGGANTYIALAKNASLFNTWVGAVETAKALGDNHTVVEIDERYEAVYLTAGRNTCDCGSGEDSWWENDARGIPLCKVCSECRKDKLKRYRIDVLMDPFYWVDEQIEEDY